MKLTYTLEHDGKTYGLGLELTPTLLTERPELAQQRLAAWHRAIDNSLFVYGDVSALVAGVKLPPQADELQFRDFLKRTSEDHFERD